MSQFDELIAKAEKILNLYSEMSEHSKNFAKTYDLKCVDKCGNCCTNPTNSVTTLEMIPLAIEIILKGEADLWLKKLNSNEEKSCILYQATSDDKVNGSCSKYNNRGVMCRLFGWSMVRRNELSVCKKIKIDKDLSVINIDDAPSMELYAKKVYELEPNLSSRIIPINEALKEAIFYAYQIYLYEDAS